MPVPNKLSVAGKFLHRFSLPDGAIILYIVDRFRVQNKESAVDPPLAGLRLLIERGYLVAFKSNSAETFGCTHGRHGRQLAMGLMELQQGFEIDIGNTVAIGEHERFIGLEPTAEALEAAPGLGVQTGIDEVHLPFGLISIVNNGFAT